MLKQLTIAVLTAALLPACILTTDNTSITDSNSSESATTGTTDGGTSVNNTETDPSVSGTDSDAGTSGTSDEPTSSTTDTPTTGEPVTTGTSDATDATTGNSGFGQCGWNSNDNYYACAPDGGTPGAEDPLAEAPIACADGVVEGDKCDERNGPVGGLGCCTPNGDLYYCDVQDTNTIILQACGL